MRSNAYQNYLEDEVLTAEPLQLVVLLYQGALDSMAAARIHTASGNGPARSKSIAKALAIVWELKRSLDMKRGGAVGLQLARLYDYIQRRLNEANRSLSDQPLVEAEKLLSTLLEGWRQCQTARAPAARQYDAGAEKNASVDYAW